MSAFSKFMKLFALAGGVRATNNPVTGGVVIDANAVFIPPTNDYAGIMIAYSAAVAAGGGTVRLLPVTYNIGANTIPLAHGICYKGAGYTTYFPGNIVDDAYVTPNGGTIIQGTSIGFGWNTADFAAIPGGIYNQLSLTGAAVEDLAIQGCTYGIKVGGLYNLGSSYCRFINIGTFNCTVWGQWYENCIHTFFNEIVDIGSGMNAAWNQDGGGVCYAFSINGYANSDVGNLLVSAPANLLTKVVQFLGRDPNAQNTGMTGGISNGGFLQGNKFNYTAFTPQLATFTGGSASISVPNYTKFAVGLPVSFTGNGGGFASLQLYVVTSITPGTGTVGTITLSDQLGGTNIVASAGSANITTFGFAPISAISERANCKIGMGDWQVIDSEGTGSALIFANRLSRTHVIPTNAIARNAVTNVDICILGSSAVTLITSYGNNLVLQMDGSSSTRSTVIGHSLSSVNVNFGNPSLQLLNTDEAQPGQVASININRYQQSRGASFSAQIPPPYNADWIKPGPPLGVSQGYSATSTLAANLSSGTQGWGVYTGTGAATWTFTGGLNDRMAGFRQTFKNQGTGALTITLSATDGTYDGLTGGVSLGKSMLLAAPTAIALGGCITLVCAKIGAAAYQWEVESLVNATLV